MRQVRHPTSHAGSLRIRERDRVAVDMFSFCSSNSNKSRKFPVVVMACLMAAACAGPESPGSANKQGEVSGPAMAADNSAKDEGVEPQSRRLKVEFEINGAPARPTISGSTNLPDGTQVGAALTRIGGQYATMGNGEVRGGRFNIVPDAPLGIGLPPGRYEVEINTPVANVQPDEVRAIVGPDYENFTGPLFSDGELGRMVSVKKFHVVPGEFDAADLQSRREAVSYDMARDNCIRARKEEGLATRTPKAAGEIDECVERNARIP